MNTEMIIRAVHDSENRFFLVRRATAQDRRLTSRARGVLMFLLSKPDGWVASANALTKEFPDLGRDSAYTTINELISHGYAARRQERDRVTGRLGSFVTDIYEMPLTDFQEADLPLPAPPDTAPPDTAPPDTAKPEHINKQSTKRNRAAEETEQQQQKAAHQKLAAAAARFATESHASEFSFEEIEAYVQATKPHAQNPGGLARTLYRNGEEDGQIAAWLQRQQGTATATPTGNEREQVRTQLEKQIAADTWGTFVNTIQQMAADIRRKPRSRWTIYEQELIAKADELQQEEEAVA